METLLNLWPHVMALLSLILGGAFFKFVLDILKWNKRNRDENERRDRLYEIAFRRCDAHGKQVTQYAIAVASAHFDSNENLLGAFLEILSGVLGYKDESGKWKMKAYPDFLDEARKELDLLEEREPKEEANNE